MAIVNKLGEIVANISQPFKVFTSSAEYTSWVATLPAPTDIDKFAIIKDWSGAITLQVNGHTYDLEGSLAQDFVPNANYSQYEVIYKDKTLYRAKVAFTAGATFNLTNWEVIAKQVFVVDDFQGSHAYTKNELIVNNWTLYRAVADFTSTATFNPINWQGLNYPEVYEYNVGSGFPVNSIVISNSSMYFTLQQVPIGTALTNVTYFRPLGSALDQFTQAEWDALVTKPNAAIISNSVFDM